MPLKVLHLSSGNLYGGVETLLVTLARERGTCPRMEPHFAFCFEGRLLSEIRALDVPATLLGAVQVRRPWTIWQARRKLSVLLAGESFDAVICHMPWTLAIFGPVIRQAGVPLLFWMHNDALGRHWTERWAARSVPDLAICNSHFVAKTLPALFPRRTPPHETIYCPISDSALTLSPEKRGELRREFDTAKDTCVIIQVGRMEPYKGHALHLDALASLADVPGWMCWIVGGAQREHEARYLAELKDRAEKAGVADRIRFLGERRDVPRLLAGADIFCQPNLTGEPFGIVFIEALYAGLPVVTAAIGGPLEIIDETCGILTPPGNAGALAEALLRLISGPDLRRSLGKAGPSRAGTLCRPDIILDKLAGIIQKTISSFHSTPAGPGSMKI
jgi:glycosyltransferase involved in cell wall biosynthesis